MTETKIKKSTTKKVTADENAVSTVDFDDIDLDKSVPIHNIAGWNVTFALRNQGGDMLLTKKSKQRLSRNEIQAQIYNGNKLIGGTDGSGSHATIYIDDKATRIWLGFETPDKPQRIFTDDVAKKLFNMSQTEFEKELPNYVVTDDEKYALNEAIERLGINDYRKIIYASKYTGYPLK